MCLLGCAGRRPADLGLTDGRLAPCPGSPNCVSSQADETAHRVDPLAFDGEPTAAWQALIQVIEQLPRTRIVSRDDRYLHAECRSRLWGFVDDLEAALEPAAGVIHLRSAARLGHSDLGVNRRRIETIRRAFTGG